MRKTNKKKWQKSGRRNYPPQKNVTYVQKMMHSANHKIFQVPKTLKVPKFQMITFCDYSTLNILAANFLDFHPSFPGLIRYHPKIRCFAKKPTKWFSRYHWNFLSPTDLLKWLGSFSKWLSITDFWYLS